MTAATARTRLHSRAQPRQPLADHVAQPFGNAHAIGSSCRRPSAAVLAHDQPFLDQVAHDLLDEQRVALRLPVDRLGQLPGTSLPAIAAIIRCTSSHRQAAQRARGRNSAPRRSSASVADSGWARSTSTSR